MCLGLSSGGGRVEVAERLRSGDPVNQQMPRGLVPDHRTFGERTVAAVDRTGREPGGGQLPLEIAHQRRPGSGVSVSGVQNRPGRRERGQRERASYAVNSKAVLSLKGDHSMLRQRSVPPVDGA